MLIQLRYAVGAVVRTFYHAFGNLTKRPWAVSIERLRQQWGALPAAVLSQDRPIWIVLNGGEVTQTVTFIKLLHERMSPTPLVLVIGNAYAAGFAARHIPWLAAVIEAPWDLRGVCSRALRCARPRAVVFIENVWVPVLARAAHALGIPTILASGLVQSRFSLHPLYARSFQLRFFDSIDLHIVKSEHDARTLVQELKIQPDRVRIGGNLKFDIEFLTQREALIPLTRKSLGPEWTSSFVILAGSIHQPEDKIIGEAVRTLRGRGHRIRLIVAPRYPEAAPKVAHELRAFGISSRPRSLLTNSNGPVAEDALLVDTFGELAALYALADAVILGGTFSRRWKTGFGQNIVEPLMAFKPVLHGPFIGQFEDIRDRLRDVWPGTQVEGSEQLARSLEELMLRPALREGLAAEAQAIILANADNARLHVSLIEDLLRTRP